jgi:hypothetical protein
MHIGTGDVPKGPTSTTGFYGGINPPNGGYTIYENKATQGPSICTPSSDAELISVTNQIAGASYTTINECFNYFASQNDKMVLANPINPIVTDELVLNIKAGILPSYPRNGSTFYDLSQTGNQFSLQNGPTFNSTGYLEFDFIDDRLYQGNVDLGLTNNAVSFDIVIKPEGTSGTYRRFFTQGGGDGLGNYPVAFRGSDGFIVSYLRASGGNSNWVAGVPRYPDGTAALDGNNPKWLHLCVVADLNIDGETNRWIYLNGRLIMTKTQPFVGTLRSGTGNLYPSYNASGGVGSLQIYNKALSQSEVNQNYYQAPIVTDGLVFAVDAGNLVSYESGSTTAYSLTGSVDGTLTNGVGFTNDNGGTWEFDGTDDLINFGVTNNIFTNDTFATIECWFKSSDNGAGTVNNGCIIGTRVGKNMMLCKGTNGIAKYLYDTTTNGNQAIWGTTDVFDQEWHYIVGVFNNGATIIYIDGVSEGTGTSTAPLDISTSHDFGVGGDPQNVNRQVYGQVAIGRVYSKALTAEEVQQNYNAQINRFN